MSCEKEENNDALHKQRLNSDDPPLLKNVLKTEYRSIKFLNCDKKLIEKDLSYCIKLNDKFSLFNCTALLK